MTFRNSLCFAFAMTGFQVLGHQSLVHPLPNADIAEHRVSCIWALLGLCLRSMGNNNHYVATGISVLFRMFSYMYSLISFCRIT